MYPYLNKTSGQIPDTVLTANNTIVDGIGHVLQGNGQKDFICEYYEALCQIVPTMNDNHTCFFSLFLFLSLKNWPTLFILTSAPFEYNSQKAKVIAWGQLVQEAHITVETSWAFPVLTFF